MTFIKMTEGFLYKEMQMRLIKDSLSQNFRFSPINALFRKVGKWEDGFLVLGQRHFGPSGPHSPEGYRTGRFR